MATAKKVAPAKKVVAPVKEVAAKKVAPAKKVVAPVKEVAAKKAGPAKKSAGPVESLVPNAVRADWDKKLWPRKK